MKEKLDVKNLFKGFSFTPESKFFRKTQRSVENLSGVLQRTQSHFDSLYQGGLRVAIISLTPLEKGFGVMNKSQVGFFKSLLKDILTKKKSEYLVSPKPINALSGYDISEIDYVQDELNDYYEGLLLPEYEYLMQAASQTSTVKIGGKDVTYKIAFPRNNVELTKNLKNDKILNIILSIEGMHSLMRAPENRNIFNNQFNTAGDTSNQIDEDMQVRFKLRIDEMKNKWLTTPLFVSLNHHFWNRLGGHASSLGKDITLLVSQNEGLHSGLTANGQMVIKELLMNKPIYIDIKHMSALCRKQYYEFIRFDTQLRNKKFPIICSHTGISSVNTIEDMIKQSPVEESIQQNKSNFLFESNINLCTEELKMIIDSHGIVGIQLDEKRISGVNVIKGLKKTYNREKGNLWQLYIKMIWANIFQGVSAVNDKKAWNIFAIGSDYDGLINHLDQYPRAADMNILRNDMLSFLEGSGDFAQGKDEIKEMNFELTSSDKNKFMFGLSPNEIISKIFEQNALDFFDRWWK